VDYSGERIFLSVVEVRFCWGFVEIACRNVVFWWRYRGGMCGDCGLLAPRFLVAKKVTCF
jgi:hypothetical protein